MSKGFASNYRIVVLAVGIFLCFGGVAARLVFLHVLDRDELVRYIDKARREIVPEKSRRGDILDTRNNLLATSRSLVVVGVDPQVLRKEDEAKWPQLASLLGLPTAKLEQIMTTKVRQGPAEDQTDDDRDIRWAKLAEDVSEETYDKITALKIKGVYGDRSFRRTYPNNQMAAHLIGYVNKEGVPASGIERYADFYLRGQDGWRESEKDGRQREMAQFRTREVPAANGYNVVLSLDVTVQHIVEREMEEVVKQFNPAHASIIVTDAQTGFILGMSVCPTFNLNEFNTAPLDSQKNFAISDQIDPGSTFKIVAVSGAINDGLVGLEDRVDCAPEYVDYNGRRLHLMRDDNDVPRTRPLTVSEVVAHSSNHGAALLAMKLGDKRFYEYACAFGFGEKSGFPVSGEISGDLNPPSKWSGIDITRIPAGYSVSATPLQIHYAMATIASGGELFRPQLIKEIRDSAGERVYRFDPLIRRRVISQTTAEKMASALAHVVTEGTGKKAAIAGYQVAGKTGTAQKLVNGRYSDDHHVTSFVGFFPAMQPRVVISVIVDDPKVPRANAWGAFVAAPSFKRVGEQLIQYLDIKPVFEASRPLVAMGGIRP
jgi:cell division protein FtsI (penicillin-binding protein 3)/stage V sporulation protein D (sporulation-specific penicillin-binding protein)